MQPDWEGPTVDDIKHESRTQARIQVANIVFTNYTAATLEQMVAACTVLWNWVEETTESPVSDDVQ